MILIPVFCFFCFFSFFLLLVLNSMCKEVCVYVLLFCVVSGQYAGRGFYVGVFFFGVCCVCLVCVYLSLNYVLELKSLPENPAYSCVFEPENTKLFEAAESKVPPLGIRIILHLEKSKLNLNLVDDASPLDIIPWKLSIPVVRFDFTSFKKDTTNLEMYKQLYLQLISEYPLLENFSPTVLKQRTELLRRLYQLNELYKPFTCRLPDDSSVYTAELRAILLALKHVYYSKGKSFLILSDSFSSLQSILNLKYDHPVLVPILELYTEITREGREIVFIWFPGHVGIRGNSAADSAAKDALDGDISVELIPFSDLKPHTNIY